MNNKNSTQLSIPLNIPEKKFKDVVKQHWNFTFARQKKVSVCAKRIMAKTICQIRDDDLQLQPYYQMHISNVIPPGTDKHSAYREIKKSLDELTDMKWLFEDINSKTFHYHHLLDTTKTIKFDGFQTGYKDGNIVIALNPALKQYFIELAHYSTYELKQYMTFRSWYSMTLFEILSAFKDTGVWYADIVEYRKIMDCENKYKKMTDLIRYTLIEPLQELENTDLAFTYKPIYDKPINRRGRLSVVAIEFKLKKNPLKKIPQAWYEYSNDYTRVLKRLEDFKITKENIAKYAKIIEFKRVRELIREWELKENSNDRINDRKKYCNAVWVRVGKAKAEGNEL